MSDCILTLQPDGKNPLIIELSENFMFYENQSEINKNGEQCVFSDAAYEFSVKYNSAQIYDASVFINGEYQKSTFYSGRILFSLENRTGKKVFSDCYGYAEIGIELILEDGKKKIFSSAFLPVLVPKNDINESVTKMVHYVYCHYDNLLIGGEAKLRNTAGLKENGYQSIYSQIILAEEIAAVYEKSFGYFKANSRFHIEKTSVVDRFDRLQDITPATLNYIVSHPEELKPANSSSGMKINNNNYQPQKTLIMKNITSFNIYENRVILGFLLKIRDELAALVDKCRKMLEEHPDCKSYSDNYIYSSFFLFAETRMQIENRLERLEVLCNKFSQLYDVYSNIFHIPVDRLTERPHPTAIFISVPQYNRIFISLDHWFNYGVYDFTKENFMLSFISVSQLYERYLLIKMIEYFKENNFLLSDTKKCVYPVSLRAKYKNTDFVNTYSFADENNKITLYYQPVIFDTDSTAVNGIGLYRNNSISATDKNEESIHGSHYYVPDFLIKIENYKGVKYIIADAKFSDIFSVKRYYLKELVFKYLFSVSTVNSEDEISEMCIIYGKFNENETLYNLYDKQLSGNSVKPYAEILPMAEGKNVLESAALMFDRILRKFII